VTLTSQPVGATLNVGASLSLSVTATGSAPITYQWRKDGTAIVQGTQSSYGIASVQGLSAGSYDVVVTNPVGSVVSAVATVVVNTPPVLLKQPVGLSAILGATARFSVTATGAVPLSYQWRKNGVNLPGQTEALLAIASVKESDAANYSVEVTNPLGTVVSTDAALTLTSGPMITDQPLATTVNPGKSVSLIVGAVGPPNGGTLSYQWRRNGTAIAGATAST
jgi:hypothetical protein